MMPPLSIALTTATGYFVLSHQQWRTLHGATVMPVLYQRLALILMVGLHAFLLYRGIDLGVGQNLSLLNVMSQLMWMIVLIVMMLTWFQPLESLILFVAPFAGVLVLLAQWFPGYHIIQTAGDPKTLWHILLALFTFSVLCLAALLAVLMAMQEHMLRRDPSQRLLQQIPPLESVEQSLFAVIWVGFGLLSCVLLTSVMAFHQEFNADLIQKLVLTGLAWLTFAALLGGRYFLGWRGRPAIRGTLIGVGLLMVLVVLSSLGIAWIAP